MSWCVLFSMSSAELEAIEQRLHRAHQRCPLGLIGRLEAEINLQIRLRLSQGREQRRVEVLGARLDDEKQRLRARSREPCT